MKFTIFALAMAVAATATRIEDMSPMYEDDMFGQVDAAHDNMAQVDASGTDAEQADFLTEVARRRGKGRHKKGGKKYRRRR